MYQLIIEKSDYSKYKLYSDTNVIEMTDPMSISGLFHGDTVYVDSNNDIKLHSRENFPKYIACELELYSKYSFKPNKKNVPTYICTPIDSKYPKFLVCSTLKRSCNSNQFVSIQYTNWDKSSLFPKGNIIKHYGDIYDKQSIQEVMVSKYMLENNNMKVNNQTLIDKYNNLLHEITDREHVNGLISIDPEGCQDIDDAFTIRQNEDVLILDIHISDVYYLLSNLDIIDNVTNITSIYLKHRISPMLPNIISNNLGSLLEKTTRLMLSLQIKYSTQTNKIISSVFRKTYGNIKKNYNYDNYPTKYNQYFKHIEYIYTNITQKSIHISDSHIFIEALMIIYNTYFSKMSNEYHIYRIQTKNDTPLNYNNYDGELQQFMKLVSSSSAIYSTERSGHDTLQISDYTHVTSPLRRIVDLMNQEIYYTNTCSLLKRLPLDYINTFNKKLKRCYRDINKLVLALDVYHTSSYNTQCYIYRFDKHKNKLYLYFPGEKISIKTTLFNAKLNNILHIVDNESNIEVKDQNDIEIGNIQLCTLLDVNINGKPNIYNTDSSIIIDFGLFQVT